MRLVPSFQRSAFLLAAAAGALLSAASYMNWCMFEGCRSLQGSEAYGLSVSFWGVVYFAVLVFLRVAPGLRGVRLLRAFLLGAGLGVEVVLIRIQWLLSEWCAVCLAVATAALFLCLVEAAGLVKARLRGELGGAALCLYILTALFGAGAGYFAAGPVWEDVMPPESYDKQQVREELGNVPFIGKPGAWPVVRVYSDYLCPYCRKKEPMINEFIREYDDQARFYFCDLPIHGQASQFYITMFLSCLLADNSEPRILVARELLFEAADNKVETAAEVISMLSSAGLELLAESDPIESTYASILALAELDGVTSTPTVVVEDKIGRRRIFKGRFEQEDLAAAIETSD
jgi:protein-disulfide isomerase